MAAAFYNEAAGRVGAIQQDSLLNALGLDVQPFEEGMVFIEDRTDGLAKIYWRRFDGETVPTGTTLATNTQLIVAAGVSDFGFLD